MFNNRVKLPSQVCALLPDLEILEYGDLSEIGERGVGLKSCSSEKLLSGTIFIFSPDKSFRGPKSKRSVFVHFSFFNQSRVLG